MRTDETRGVIATQNERPTRARGGLGGPPPENTAATTTRQCAVLGSPVEHSLSPALHRAAYAWLGIDWVYQRHQVEAHELADFVAGLDDRWRGLSCTMPLKEAVVPLGVPDEIVTALGVGNTLIFDGHPADPTTTLVRNTDVPGLESALRAAGVEHAETALLVGNGATARSSVCGVARLGVTTIYVLARDPAKTEVLARLGEQYGVTLEHLGWDGDVPTVDLALSSAPAQAVAAVADRVAEASPVVFDAIYDPWPTALAAAAERRGRTVVNGLDLLAHQAVGQVALMTGLDVPAEVMLTAGRQALSRRARA